MLQRGTKHDPRVVFADETAVPLTRAARARDRAHSLFSARRFRVSAEAGLACHPDAVWCAHLRARVVKVGPIKWADALPVVLFGAGAEPDAIRRGLSEASIVIVDPLDLYREMDLNLASRTMRLPSLAAAHLRNDPAMREAFRPLDALADRLLLSESGVGRISGLLSAAPTPVIVRPGLDRSSDLVEALCKRLGGSAGLVAKLASKAATLVAHEYDGSARTGLLQALGHLVEARQFITPQQISMARLEALADRRVVFDQGHENVIELVRELHQEAKARVDELQRWLNPLVLPSERGYVASDSDAGQFRLQLADVAAGWARELIPNRGITEVVRVFRCVVFNGVRLDMARAKELDRKRVFHERLMHG